jgi:hypothetical protein
MHNIDKISSICQSSFTQKTAIHYMSILDSDLRGTTAAVAGKRRVVEACFEIAKSQYGPDEYEVHSWVWHHHVI